MRSLLQFAELESDRLGRLSMEAASVGSIARLVGHWYQVIANSNCHWNDKLAFTRLKE
ncbi:MAG: hypothetical protein WBA41_28800 [Rivularia sp. (in: cyanobacteria)]